MRLKSFTSLRPHGIWKNAGRVILSGRTDKEFTNDDLGKVSSGAVKYDGGKSPVFRGCVDYFPRALEAVAAVSNFGASKYAWKGWEGVEGGFNRYSDALVRHLTYAAKGETVDSDSGLLHEAHCAWNALARLELKLRKLEDDRSSEQS